MLLVLVCWLRLGCGSGRPFDYVTRFRQSLVRRWHSDPRGVIRLSFAAQDAAAVGDAYPDRASPIVNAQGEFDCVTSYKYGDGLIPGKHKVAIRTSPSNSGKSVVPKEYLSADDHTALRRYALDAPLISKCRKPKEKR